MLKSEIMFIEKH